MKKRIGINFLTVCAALLLCVFFPSLLIRKMGGRLDDVLELTGITLILLGLLLRTSARGYKADGSRNSHALVTGGPYSMVRNPMYLGIVVAGTGVVLVVGQWWGLVLFVLGFFFRYQYLFRTEERYLEEHFGDSYREYKKRVPRIVPSLPTLFGRDVRDLLPLKIEWFGREFPSFVIVLAIVMAVETWEENGYLGWQNAHPGLLKFTAIIAGFLVFIVYLLVYNAQKTQKNGNGSL